MRPRDLRELIDEWIGIATAIHQLANAQTVHEKKAFAYVTAAMEDFNKLHPEVITELCRQQGTVSSNDITAEVDRSW
jgi:hypothetical protein